MFVGCFLRGWGDKKKPLKAAFMAWMDCRCSDRVVIMVYEEMGGCFDGVCMYRFLWGRRTGCVKEGGRLKYGKGLLG